MFWTCFFLSFFISLQFRRVCDLQLLFYFLSLLFSFQLFLDLYQSVPCHSFSRFLSISSSVFLSFFIINVSLSDSQKFLVFQDSDYFFSLFPLYAYKLSWKSLSNAENILWDEGYLCGAFVIHREELKTSPFLSHYGLEVQSNRTLSESHTLLQSKRTQFRTTNAQITKQDILFSIFKAFTIFS